MNQNAIAHLQEAINALETEIRYHASKMETLDKERQAHSKALDFRSVKITEYQQAIQQLKGGKLDVHP